MKKILLFIILASFAKTFSQESTSLIGKWKTLEVSDKNFSIKRNDSIILPEKWKTRSKVALQDERARIRTNYSENIFIFTSEKNFSLYRSENPRTLIFDGKFTIQNDEILLNVKNSGRQDVETKAEYYFENGELHLKMYTENNNPVHYTLQRITK